ncbi:MAG TPA: hypothetical protein VFE15_02255 [Marmoricola sp.]|jgi:hypothetical protein|nr:hypothetical protein [Marmoricola sp.]
MTATDLRPVVPGRPSTRSTPHRRRLGLGGIVGIVAVLAVAGWAPFIAGPASPDEGGYLLIASQWGHGSSLYGNYWVDRPPLLIAIHAVAVFLGGTAALRVIGMLAVVASVVLAAALVRVATVPWVRLRAGVTAALPVVIAGIFLTTPMFGTTYVDGELLSVPLVLCGMVALVRAFTVPGSTRVLGWSCGAGAAAVGAAMVKQNAIDVFVAALVLGVGQYAAGNRRRTLEVARGFAVGALASGVVIVGTGWLLGTSPVGLWSAVVTFRFQAATIISQSATVTNSARMVSLITSAALSLAPVVIAVAAYRSRGLPSAAQRSGPNTPVDLRWVAAAMLVWEVVSILGGGSFWLHYLMVCVPGMVVLAVAAAQRPPSLRLTTGLVAVAAAGVAVVAVVTAATAGSVSTGARVGAYLRAHSRPGDTAVVAFGHPDIVWDAGLSSPYAELWSLPVRVRDPQLRAFDTVLASRSAPTWVVVSGTSIATWGVDATDADQILGARYTPQDRIGGYYLWHRNGAPGAG